MPINDVRVEIYRSFVEEGRAPLPIEIANKLGAPLVDIERALMRLHDDDIIALLPGTHLIWLAHPFAGSDSPFKVISQDRTWDAICIWDALGILAVLGADGEISTPCPDCGEELRFVVKNGKLGPTDHIVHFGVPAARWYEDVGYT